MFNCLIFKFFDTFCQYGNDKLFNAAPYGPDCGKKFMITCILISEYLFHESVQRFRSVVVITFALHAKGHGFEPRRNLILVRWNWSGPNRLVYTGWFFLNSHPLFVWAILCFVFFTLKRSNRFWPLLTQRYFKRLVQRQLSDPCNFQVFFISSTFKGIARYWINFSVCLIADDPIFKKLFSAGDHQRPPAATYIPVYFVNKCTNTQMFKHVFIHENHGIILSFDTGKMI